MTISTEDIKKLRDETGIGMMDCKRALTEANGDIERAKEVLREQGLELITTRAMRKISKFCYHLENCLSS